MNERRLTFKEPIVRDNMIIFGCPKCAKPETFIEKENGTILCEQCGTYIVVPRLNRLFGKDMAYPATLMRKEIDFNYIAGTTKEKLSMMFSYLRRTRFISDKQKILSDLAKELLFRDLIVIEEEKIKESMKSLLSIFDIPFKSYSDSVVIINYQC